MIPPIFRELKETPDEKGDRLAQEAHDKPLEPSKLPRNEYLFLEAEENHTLLSELFTTYDYIEKEVPLDVTNWRYGFENVSKLADLEFEALMNASSRMTVTYEDSWNFQDAVILETSLTFFKNDLEFTVKYMKAIQAQGYLNPNMYHKYRALLFSLVDHIKVTKSISQAKTESRVTLGETLDKISTDIGVDLERFNLNEPIVEKDEKISLVLSSLSTLLSKPESFDIVGSHKKYLSQMYIDGKDQAIAEFKSYILILINMMSKDKINIRNDKILQEAKEIFDDLTPENENQFNTLIAESIEFLTKIHNPRIIAKPVYGFEKQPHISEDPRLGKTRFSKNAIPISNK
jgi:hypothetical protein